MEKATWAACQFTHAPKPAHAFSCDYKMIQRWGYSITPTSVSVSAVRKTAMTSRNWCWTWNNPPAALPDIPNERYSSWQLEKGDNGTLHWQGYTEFTKPTRLAAIKSVWPSVHAEFRRGTAEQARDYTRKDDTRQDGPWERGTFTTAAGKRSDLEDFKLAVRAGTSKRDLFEAHADVCAKYPRFVAEYQRLVREDNITRLNDYTPRLPWQQSVLTTVQGAVDERSITWVYDAVGNHGKTYLATHLVDKYGAFYTNGGKAVDLTYAYEGQPIVIFDYVRDSKDYVNYGVIEQLKNGILMSTKYESGMKRFTKPHVLVLANFRPDVSKMSADRWKIIELNSVGQEI